LIIFTRRKMGLILFTITFFLLYPTYVHSNDVNPFQTRNLNPFTRVFSWPSGMQSRIEIPGNFQLGMRYEVGNSCSWDTSNVSEQIYLDGESSWLTMHLEYRPTDRYSFGIEVPYVSHSRGYLDKFVDLWHHLTGLPQGRRKSVSERQIRYSYKTGQMRRVEQNSAEAGFGNILVTGALQLLKSNANALAIYSGYSIPAFTGQNPLHKTSSDLSILISGSQRLNLLNLQPVLFASIGVIFPGRIENLASIQRHHVLTGRIGGAVNLSENIVVKCQFDFNSPFYESDLDQIGAWGGQLILGGVVRQKKSRAINFGVTEDNIVSTAPDFGFLIGIDQVLSIH